MAPMLMGPPDNCPSCPCVKTALPHTKPNEMRCCNETRGSVGWACVAHLSFCFEETLYRTFHISVSEEKIFLEITRNKHCLWWPCLLMDRDEMSNRYRGPSIDPSYQVLVHLAKRFQRRLLQIGRSETSIACGAMLVNGS